MVDTTYNNMIILVVD